jgi:hypothetical protein
MTVVLPEVENKPCSFFGRKGVRLGCFARLELVYQRPGSIAFAHASERAVE